jgi:hypothetical protein
LLSKFSLILFSEEREREGRKEGRKERRKEGGRKEGRKEEGRILDTVE